ncbi:acyl-CoA dehydrogenase [Wenzhouxiangella sp. XN24]|uniref:acyl-CoA dehydrogenase n=1 Tax=Wenzhouxiangella sp. XN24 TaxID=2713569 RepID=UPI0013EA9279|nr:acyl-CoA dehydrogenase [Wenzhouxiangella sp. XN24]NGX15607.1 acyl-CoA dehydrogenase [Wenzhouxiangella sp. XN24]
MSGIIWLPIIIVAFGVLAYRRSPLATWTGVAAVLLLGVQLTGGGLSLLPWVVLGAVGVLLNVKSLRRSVLGKPIMKWFKSVLPPMSSTEKDAIDAGTVWWDAELFSGRPNWNTLLRTPRAELTDEERAFLDGPVEELCRMLDDWKINHELNDLPPEVWSFLGKHRFFAMIIPKEYGGLDFSARAQSEVVMKIASRSGAAAVTVMVPNSLGPGELLMHYGTHEQKQHFLPRLARGEEIPAFALTGPWAGSDAGSMPDAGVVCKGEYKGKEVLGFRVNWAKRYITLGPVATILGLAFKAQDPDGLLGQKKDLGITCALIPTDTPGVEIGLRHDPGGAFMNGPNTGTDVFVPMEWIIGGQAQVGNGWKMLMDCLSVGRAISLPALGTAGGKAAARMTGAYARVRRQFKIPIGRFEGIEEPLARIGGVTYRMDAARVLTATALDLGGKPSVLSAILKYNNTEGMRQAINDAMDVHAGRAVCLGPSNYLAQTYQTVPVAITVEGANILTRSMIIFGQGAIRCHPYVLKEMLAAADPDEQAGLKAFDDAFFAHVGFTISNLVRSLVLAVTGGRLAPAPDLGPTSAYATRLTRMSASFALLADVAMLTLGGDLKRREKISGRFADILSHLYMASAVLKRFEDDGRPEEDLPIVCWALDDSLAIIEERLDGILRNFPVAGVGPLLRPFVLPLGRRFRGASDRLGHEVAKLLLSPSATRDRLTDGLYIQRSEEDPMGLMELALEKVIAGEPVERKLAKAFGASVNTVNMEAVLEKGIKDGVIDAAEAELVREAMDITTRAIAVDDFPGLEKKDKTAGQEAA